MKVLIKKGEKKQIKNTPELNIPDKKISFAIIFQFCILITNSTIKHVLNIENPTTRSIISAIFMLVVGILFLKNLNIVLKRIGKLFTWTYFVFIFIFLFNALIFKENAKYILGNSFWFFLMCLPISLYYIAIENKVIFLNMLIKSAYYQIALGFFYTVSTNYTIPEYDMVFSYQIMIPIIILFYKIYNKFNIIDFILIIFGVSSIVIIGSRGPILSIILFSTIFIFIDLIRNRKKFKSVYMYFLGLIAVFFSFVYFEQILYQVNMFLIKFGISSRTMILLSGGNADFSTGRSYIYKLVIQKILEKPVLGYGLAGDRIFLYGSYPHNIFLEVLVQFGIIFGSSILTIFIFYWIKGIALNKNKEEQDLAIMFFGIGLVQLFISGSYIEASNFWLFMAICFNSVHFKKQETEKVCRCRQSVSVRNSTYRDIRY